MGIDADLESLNQTRNVKFRDLLGLTVRYFGKPRIAGSHHIFKTPWKGQPWVNLQKDGSMAKPYQVKQVIKALEKLKELKNGR